MDWLAQPDKSIYNFTKQINRELLSRQDISEQFHIQEQGYEIEQERNYIENEAFLCPLLSVVEFYQTYGVLKVILDSFQ